MPLRSPRPRIAKLGYRRLPAGLVICLLALAPGSATARPVTMLGPPTVSPDVPVTAMDLSVRFAHNSPMLVADPSDRRFVAMAGRQDHPGFGCELDLSGDGGQTWAPANPVKRLPSGAEECYGSEAAFDRSGRLYFLFVGLHTSGHTPMGAFLTSSTNRGRTFTEPRKILDGNAFAVRMAIDTSMGSKGRIHVVWLQATSDPGLGSLPSPPNPIFSAYSDNGGKSFSPRTQVSDPQRRFVVAPALALGPNHTVHVLYYDLGDDARDYHGLEGPPWEGTWSLVASSSRDGGRRFDPGSTVDDAIVPTERVLLIFTMPPATIGADAHGSVFVAWDDARSGDPDIMLRRSGDAGHTWAASVRLNDDAMANGRWQYLPHLSVAPNGRVDVIFYDRRNDPANVHNDVYYTSSADGGRTFSSNIKLNRLSSNPRSGIRYLLAYAGTRVEFGVRLAITSWDDAALAAWTDSRYTIESDISVNSGPTEHDVYAARINIANR